MKFHLLSLKEADILFKKGYIKIDRNWRSSWSRLTYYEKTQKGIEFTGNHDDIKIFWDETTKTKTVPISFLKNTMRIGIRVYHSNVDIRYESTKEYWSNILTGCKNFKRIII